MCSPSWNAFCAFSTDNNFLSNRRTASCEARLGGAKNKWICERYKILPIGFGITYPRDEKDSKFLLEKQWSSKYYSNPFSEK
jgi:hypothetical protein